MKTKIFLLFFLCIPVIATGQTPTTVYISHTPNCGGSNNRGICFDEVTQDYYLQGDWNLGHKIGHQKGRGYMEYNIQSIPPNATITDAKLQLFMFKIKTTEKFDIKKLSNPSECATTSGAFIDHGSSATTPITVTVNDNTVQQDVTLTSFVTTNFSNGEDLYLGLVHQNETDASYGLLIATASLKITYTVPVTNPPNAPTSLQTNGTVTSTACPLKWTKPSGTIDEYRVYNGATLMKTVIGENTTNTTITVSPNTTYNFTVKAVNSAGPSGASNSLQVKTPDISGSNTVCYDGSQFSLVNPPSGTIYWTLSSNSNFTVSPSSTTGPNHQTTVTRIGSGSESAVLQARVNSAGGTIIATKTIMPCTAPSLSGPTTVCTGNTATFTISNYPSGAYTLWNKPDFLGMPQTVTNSSATYTVNPTNPISFAMITAKIYSLSDNSLIASLNKTFYLDSPPVGAISGANMIGYLKSENYSIIPSIVCDLNILYEWRLNNDIIGSGAIICIKSVANPVFKQMNNTESEIPESSGGDISKQPPVYNATYELSVTAKNSSGMVLSSNSKNIIIYGYPLILLPLLSPGAPDNPTEDVENNFIKVYPNPTGNILNVEIEAETTEITYDIRLYDGQGNMLRNAKTKGGTIEFNVANLPNGIYYLHVYDGVNGTPEIQQIVIEH